MRVLIVGATGRLGRMVAAQWRRAPPPGLQPLLQARTPAEGHLHWSPLDGPAGLLAAPGGPIGAMIVLAGPTPGNGQDLALNAPIARACIAAAQAAGIRRVLLASSSAVYGIPPDDRPLAEGAPLNPATPYGLAKLEMERAVAQTPGLCCLRIGNVAGADALLAPRPPRPGPVILDTFADDSGPVRSYIGPAALARVLATLATAPGPLPPALNLAAPGAVAMADLARAAGLTVQPRPAPPGALPRLLLDTAALQRLHPFAPADSDPAAMAAEWRGLP